MGMHALSRLVPDRFILILLGTVALASVVPVGAERAATANIISSGAVFLIFLLHGIRLPRGEVIGGLRNWRIQGGLFLFIFGAMTLAGLGVARVVDGWLPPLVAIGFLYCGVLPTTVQSATTYSSLARGNVAISVIASAWINLAAIIVTPTLFALLAGRGGGITLSSDLAVKIATILLLPFLIGQVAQRWVRPWVMRYPGIVKSADQTAIAIAVYVAFSAAVVDGIWSRLSPGDLLIVVAGVAAMLGVGFGGAWMMGGAMRAPAPDRAAMLFSGAHKSIAVGAPLAALLFPASMAGAVLLPILLYHLAQLFISAWIAPALAERMAGAASTT